MTELETVNGGSADQIRIVSRRLEPGIVFMVCGEIDVATAPILGRELLRAEESHDLVAIDLSDTSFLDSTGLHAIMEANLRLRERGGRLLIIRCPPAISRLFDLTGLSDHLDVLRDETELERLAANRNHARLSSGTV